MEREEQVSILWSENISGDFIACETADHKTSLLMDMLSDKIQKEPSETCKVILSINDNQPENPVRQRDYKVLRP